MEIKNIEIIEETVGVTLGANYTDVRKGYVVYATVSEVTPLGQIATSQVQLDASFNEMINEFVLNLKEKINSNNICKTSNTTEISVEISGESL